MKSKIHELKKNNFKIVSNKFMFSAVALVAFSFAGMANTGGEDKIELLEMETLEVNSPQPYDCIDYANIVVDRVSAVLDFEMSFETELDLLCDAISNCPY